MDKKTSSPAKAAEQLIDRYDVRMEPVNPEWLCSVEGIKIHKVDFTEIEEKTQTHIASAIHNNPKLGLSILINKDDSLTEQRFAIAMAMGSYILHMNRSPKNNQLITRFHDDRSVPAKQAENFAAHLLAPDAILKRCHARMVIPSAGQLAERLMMPKRIVEARLDELGLMYI